MALMVPDSDPNAAKHALYTLKVRGQKVFFDFSLENVGAIYIFATDPLTPFVRDLCSCKLAVFQSAAWDISHGRRLHH